MYNFQPKALTDRELIKYGGLWLDEEPLPIEAQREILLRLEQRCDELEHALAEVKKLTAELQAN
jgi:hypothetical protein